MCILSVIFPRWVNRLPLLFATGGGIGAFGLIGFVWYFFSPAYTDVGYAPRQPVPYSHKTHAGNLGMDCRYCHSLVEEGPHATVPPTQTCMNCHSHILPESPNLRLVRESWADDRPVPWIRIHKLPDYVHFSHEAHVNAGVGCVSCHGRVDQMVVVRQVEPLSMSWCLDCHRDPAPHVRPRELVTQMDYVPESGEGQALVRQYRLNPPENCSACHF